MKNVLMMILIIIAMTATAATVNATLPTPESYWALDNNLDDAGTNNNDTGTIVGDPQYVEGRVGQALEFDGKGDGVYFGNESLYDYDGVVGMSISFWAKIPKGIRGYGSIVDKMFFPSGATAAGDVDPARGLGWMTQTMSLNYGDGVSFYARDTVSRYEVTDYFSSFNDGKWHHYVITFNGTGADALKLYIDGDFVASYQYQTSNSDVPLAFGYNYSRPGIWDWEGALDEVEIFGEALSAPQVTELFAAGGGSCAGYEADIDSNCAVNIDDLKLLAQDWLECGEYDGDCLN